MDAYERYVTVSEGGRLIISDLPLPVGQTVRVTVEVDSGKRAALAAELRDLLKTTQALPRARTITDEEIAAEIDAVRRSSAP